MHPKVMIRQWLLQKRISDVVKREWQPCANPSPLPTSQLKLIGSSDMKTRLLKHSCIK